MPNLAVRVQRFVDAHQPRWVACEFEDVEGRRHTLIDKVPVFTSEDLEAHSTYPQAGTVQCEILARWRDANGRELVRISTANPHGIRSTEGLSEFVVAATQISERKTETT